MKKAMFALFLLNEMKKDMFSLFGGCMRSWRVR